MNLSAFKDLLASKKKAIAAFVATWVVALLVKFVPWVHIDADALETLVVSVITAVTVHQVSNTPKAP